MLVEREERERQGGGREGGSEREERKRLHLLDAPALGSLPISVSWEGSGVKMQNAYRKVGKKRGNGSEGVCTDKDNEGGRGRRERVLCSGR